MPADISPVHRIVQSDHSADTSMVWCQVSKQTQYELSPVPFLNVHLNIFLLSHAQNITILFVPIAGVTHLMYPLVVC